MTAYEKKIKINRIVLSVLILGILIAFNIVLICSPKDSIEPLGVIVFGMILIWCYILPNIKKMKKLLPEHVEYYKNIRNVSDSVHTKMIVYADGIVKGKSWIIDWEGLHGEGIDLRWEDYSVLLPETGFIRYNTRQVPARFIRLDNLIGFKPQTVSILCDLKSFYLIKAFYPKEIPQAAEFEKWILAKSNEKVITILINALKRKA